MLIDDLLTNPYVTHFAQSPSTLATFGVLFLLSVVVALAARRRRLLVLLTGTAAAAIGGVSLAPAYGWTTLTFQSDPLHAVAAALRPRPDDWWAWSFADGPANVALYVPFALCLGLLLRRPLAAFVVSALLSVAIESYQAATGTRVGTFADVVSNGLGATMGTVMALTLLIFRRVSVSED